MSNGDDVLDNWEEIDEAELTNKLQKLEKECKDKDESKLEEIEAYSALLSTEIIPATSTTTTNSAPGAMKLLQRAAQTKILPGSTVNTSQQSSASTVVEDVTSPLDDMNSTFQPVLMVLHKDSDEYQSANYAQPISTQTVKILRRPTQSSEPRNNGVRPKQPIKTLQQREQEYAEARLRILGSAKNPEDDATANASSTASTTSNTTSTISNTSATITSTPTATVTQSAPVTNNTQAKVNTPINRNQQQQQQQPQQQQQQQHPHYGTVQSAYNNFYQQNLYYQKQQLQQQQQQQLQHSLSSPGFGNNRLQFSTAGLLPTPAITPVVTGNLQQRYQLQPLQHHQQQHSQQQQQQQQLQQSWSPVVGGSVSSYTLQRQQQRQQQHQHQQLLQQHQQIDVLRTPRGPDGSTGFQMRR